MIFITGCARSGTSLTAELLKAHGCNLGPPDSLNVLFENINIRQEVLKPYLKSIGADPLGQRGFPDTDNLPPLNGLADKVNAYIGAREPKAYKDAKLTFVYPVFRDAFPDAKWVLVRRDRERIIDSCLDTSFMFAYRERLGWSHWVKQHEVRFERMKAELDLIEFWPDQVVSDPQAFSFVAKFLGLTYHKRIAKAVVRHEAWHSA